VTHSNRFVLRYVSTVLLVGAAACHPGGETAPAPATPSADVLVAGPRVDLGSSVPIAKLALTRDANEFRGGYLTHGVTIREGIIDVTPRHLDPATRKTIVGGAIGLETTGIVVGSDPLLAAAEVAVQSAQNAVQIARGDVTEEITNRDDGVEQAWRFASKPVAGGDLTVAVAVSGQEFVTANASGLHFKSPLGLGVRYSHAIWRDAAGADYDIPARFEDGRILITVPENIIDESVFPAVLDPTISAEQFVDTPTNGTTGLNSRNQDAASDGTGYFVVWQDNRDSRDADIFGTRVGASGNIVDTAGIRINAVIGIQQNPTVAFVGTGYVVAWQNEIATGNNDIVAAFVNTAGAVTQLGTIAGTAANETAPALAGRGNEALLVWSDGANLHGAIFNGSTFGAAFDVAAGANVEKEPAVSANPTGDYLVAYAETIAAGNDNIRGVMVTAAGAPGTAFDIDASAGLQNTPATAFNGTNHVVVWTSLAAISGARVGPTGTLVDAVPVALTTNAFAQVLPDVSCTASNCLVAWQDSRNTASVRDVFGAVVSSALAVTVPDFPIAGQARTQVTPAVAVAGAQYFATWSDNRDLDYTYVRGARVSGAGVVQDSNGIVLATSIARFQAPAVSVVPSGFTDVFFSAAQADGVDLLHTRFTGSAQIDTVLKVVSSAIGAQVNPAASFLGTDSIVAWQDTRGADRDIFAARVSNASGATLDATGIPVSVVASDQFAPAVASSGNSALIVWQDRRNGLTTGFDIFGAIVSTTGAVTVNDIAVCTGAGDQGVPRVAFDTVNGVYLVVFNDPSSGSVDIRGVRVNAAGAVLDANCGVTVSGAAGAQFTSDVTFGGGKFMVVWEDRRNDAILSDIYGTRASANGGVLTVEDPAGIAVAKVDQSAQTLPTVAFGNGSFLVAWSDARNAGTTGTDIFGAQIGVANGSVSANFPISTDPENESSPRLIAGVTTTKPFGIAYNKSNPELDSVRIQFRRISIGTSTGSTCGSNSQCESGFCVDGACCDTACGGGVRNDCQACSVKLGAAVDGTCSPIAASVRYICRDYANRTDTPTCDDREYCDGTSAVCPPDLGTRQGLTCTSGGGIAGTCPANDTTGSPHVCQ
jgi:hypothetical protein